MSLRSFGLVSSGCSLPIPCSREPCRPAVSTWVVETFWRRLPPVAAFDITAGVL